MSKELVQRLRTEAKLRHGIPQGSEFGERDLRILAHEPRWEAADRIEALEAEVERLKSALSEISRQKTSAEHTDYLQFVEEADVVGGYDELIRVARAALSPSDKGEGE